MEELEDPQGTPALSAGDEPKGSADPRDPLRPDIEEEDNTEIPPMADPMADMELREEDADLAPREEGDGGDAADEPVLDNDDMESELEELDEAEFKDFDPSAVNILDQPLQVDESNVALLGVHKRKRTAEEEAERERKKKRKEKRREKPRRSKKSKGNAADEEFEGGEELDGKRSRKSKIGPHGRTTKPARRQKSPVNENDLTPEARKKKALERKMDEALKSHRISRRKQTAIMEERADQEIELMRERINFACTADANARTAGGVAIHKLQILPDVVELMNRNTIQSQLVDPDVNILESVRYMLEPADQDAALPNYRIQRELFAILGKLNISKEALKSSGIGKVVLFYTRSIQPQPDIKRQAERLVGEWMRVILGKSKDSRTLAIEQRNYDPVAMSQRTTGSSQAQQAAAALEKRRRVLEPSRPSNRARAEGGVGTYTIAPVSNLSNYAGVGGRRGGAGLGEDRAKRIVTNAGIRSAAKR